MDNSEEGIIIIKNNKIDYINDKFLEQQQNLIEEVILENITSETQIESIFLKILYRIKQYYRHNQEMSK